MKILVTGASGFVGKTLVARLVGGGHEVVALSRSIERAKSQLPKSCTILAWDPLSGPPPAESFQGVDAVVHLAGENIGEKRWTKSQKQRIRDSRVLGTRHLVEGIQRRKGKPLSVISSSAIGYYGDRGEELLHEISKPGAGFLAGVCADWEREARALPYGAGRLVIIRTGVVIGRGGGVLKRLLPLFRTGLGGPVGTGKQWMSWIHIEDLVSLMILALQNPALEGVMNGVSPNPATNETFSIALAKAVGKSAFLRAPAGALRLMLGEMSELVLGSQRVVPDKAITARFAFQFPTLDAALANVLAAAVNPEVVVSGSARATT